MLAHAVLKCDVSAHWLIMLHNTNTKLTAFLSLSMPEHQFIMTRGWWLQETSIVRRCWNITIQVTEPRCFRKEICNQYQANGRL